MINQQKIPCPQCQTDIYFDVNALLQGVGFSCKKCGAVVSISQDSMSTANDVYKQYESLKQSSKQGA